MRKEIYICDRCGKELAPARDNIFKIHIGQKEKPGNPSNFLEQDIAQRDFCRSCMEDIYAFASKNHEQYFDPTIRPTPEIIRQPEELELPAPEKQQEKPKSMQPVTVNGKKAFLAPPPSRRKLDYEKIWKLKEEGRTAREIKKMLNLTSEQTVYDVAKRIREQEKKAAEMRGTQEPEEPEKPAGPTKNKMSIPVNYKNCISCEYATEKGYCDFSSITGSMRNDQPGRCTWKKERTSKC